MNSIKRYPSVIMGTCVVPWTSDFQFDEALFRLQVRNLTTQLTPHLYVFGTAGEGYAVNESLFESISRAFLEEMESVGGQPTLGIISLSLPTILERIEKGRSWGCRNFQISLPSWGGLNDREVDLFFAETCGRFTDCAFLHYNLKRTKRLLTGTEYGRLAERYSNLVASKNTNPDEGFLLELLEKAPAMQHFLGESGYALMRERYECGLLISVASTNFARAHAFVSARGELLRNMAKDINASLNILLESAAGVAYIDGAYDKALYKLHCPSFPLRLLPPYISMDDSVFESYQENLRKTVSEWVPEISI